MKRKYLCTILSITLSTVLLLAGCSSNQKDQPTTAEVESNPVTQSTPIATEGVATPSPEISPVESTPTPEPSWTVVLDNKISHPTNIAGFLNETYGLTVGYNGEIHYTNDGGKTWPRSENSSLCRFCLDIVDENLAWSGGNGNNVRMTKDGGKTWSAVSDIKLKGGHSNIDFVDDTNGWITSLSNGAVTKDGGATWTELNLPEDVKGIAAICLRTPEDGYLLSHNGMFFITADGGKTWNKQDLGFEKYKIVDQKNKSGLYKNNFALADISFSDESNGIIVFVGPEPGNGMKTWCLTTADGGATWTSELLTPVEGFSPARVFITGDCNYITLGTNDNRVIVLKSLK